MEIPVSFDTTGRAGSRRRCTYVVTRFQTREGGADLITDAATALDVCAACRWVGWIAGSYTGAYATKVWEYDATSAVFADRVGAVAAAIEVYRSGQTNNPPVLESGASARAIGRGDTALAFDLAHCEARRTFDVCTSESVEANAFTSFVAGCVGAAIRQAGRERFRFAFCRAVVEVTVRRDGAASEAEQRAEKQDVTRSFETSHRNLWRAKMAQFCRSTSSLVLD